MTVSVLDWLQTTAYSAWVRESWGWALALTIHAFGNALVVGLIFIIGLRLFGFFRTIPYASSLKLFPFIWFGVVFQFMSGFTLWMTKPAKYVTDGVFDVKFTLVVIGVVLTFFYQKTIRREVANWQAAGAVSRRGITFAAATCLVWGFVIIMGRLTAYLGTLYGYG